MPVQTLAEVLKASSTEKQFSNIAGQALKAAGLAAPSPLTGEARLVLTRIMAQLPPVHWLTPGETFSARDTESHSANGRFSTRVTVHFDRQRNVVAVHHVRGQEGDYNHSAFAEVKRLPNAAKAQDAWAKVLKKYRIEGAAPAPAKPVKTTPRPAAPSKGTQALLEAVWRNPDDRRALSVLADAWAEQGDPRGEFIALSLVDKPTPDQVEKRVKLVSKFKGPLVGPAREFLREWHFGSNGLVEWARIEADKLIAGLDEVCWLNPRLALTVTSLKKLSVAQALGAKSLERVYFVDLSGVNLTDKVLGALTPALVRVRHLGLSCRGQAKDVFSPAAFKAFADQLECLEYFHFDFYAGTGVAPLGTYLEVMFDSPGFKKLRGLAVPGADPVVLKERFPKLKGVFTSQYQSDRRPETGVDLELFKVGRYEGR